jgi:PBP1b-binding outer membrane lipoprotein LpoB|tara:strand:+ start:120 stop:236 length:117 start_codon:yes stop_codon:yes gene_type:complete
MKKLTIIAITALFLTSCMSTNYQSCAAYASVDVKNEMK